MNSKIIMGIRTSPSEIRYALLESFEDKHICFLNQKTENKLCYPPALSDISEKLKWLNDELDRILRQNPQVANVVIKTNEFAGNQTLAKRESCYADAVCILVAAKHSIHVSTKLYSQIGSSSKDIKLHAESRVGKTEKYWNEKMADAIVAAYSER